ncbi:hypothetical protein B0H34DRAFT_705243 [Crassisporium funariophilum]|nr:hypothetical protein B0H34DRAFT_705243 [Crassisporium funariophilum]
MAGQDQDVLPDTIAIGEGATMTFRRTTTNSAYPVEVHIQPPPSESKDRAPLPFYVPPHWHATHDELFRVLCGRLEVCVGGGGGGAWRVYTREDGEVRIGRGVVHSLRGFPGEELHFEEGTDPMDDSKELFFRNFLAGGKLPSSVFDAMLVSYHGDSRPAFPGHIRWLETAFVTVVGRWLAPLLGYKLKYESLKKV